jgi:uncharacterized protein YpiB (UPF0302 family)
VTEKLLEHSLQNFQKEKLLQLIDDALDRQDKEGFQRLSQQLINLKKNEK